MREKRCRCQSALYYQFVWFDNDVRGKTIARKSAKAVRADLPEKTYPYRHENDTSFKLLLECAMSESSECGVKHETVVQLFEAVLSNPLLMRRQRENLYQGYGIYLHEFGNKQRSYELLQLAAEDIVSKSLYQNLVGVALELKQKQDAEKYMLMLKNILSDEEKKSDMIGQFETYIASCCEQDLSIKIGF